MSDNVSVLPVITRLPIPPERVIAGAAKEKFKRVLIIGVLEDGEEFFASSDPDGGTALWDMERARFKLMKVGQDA